MNEKEMNDNETYIDTDMIRKQRGIIESLKVDNRILKETVNNYFGITSTLTKENKELNDAIRERGHDLIKCRRKICELEKENKGLKSDIVMLMIMIDIYEL
jgi:predicted RNase H-like nuclease (RuvC/YqgF family)